MQPQPFFSLDTPIHDDKHAQAVACFDAAVVCHAQGLVSQALVGYEAALDLHPLYVQAWSNRGAALQQLHRFEEALHNYNQALVLQDDLAAIHNNKGVTLKELHRLGEAIACFDRAIALAPDYAEAWVNRGFAKSLQNEFDSAIVDYQEALRLSPNFKAAQFNLSLSQLALGDYEQGWINYESRWLKDPEHVCPDFPGVPVWLGQFDLHGKTILLHSEQGFGDILQFCRYATCVAERGARVILQVPKPLKELMSSLSGPLRVLAEDEPLPDLDAHCPLMSLPLACGTNLSNIPHATAYLQADPQRIQLWQTRLKTDPRPRVGLVWSGGFRPGLPQAWATHERRNLPLKWLTQLKDLPAQFISLQKGEPAESQLRQALRDGWPGPALHCWTEQLHDFSDTAALIAALDLVIAVDTSVAHLAAALGKPVWLLSRHDACWRWLTHRADSPWYSSLHIYRQPTAGDWDSVMRQVVQDLQSWLAGLVGVSPDLS